MRVVIICLFGFSTLLFISCHSQLKMQQVQTVYVEQYCGGARPSDEMLEEIQKPKPLSTTDLVIISSKGKVIRSRTDENGTIKLQLRDGEYRIKEAWRYNKVSPNGDSLSHFDKSCLKAEWEQDNFLLSVKDNVATLKTIHEIVKHCAWNLPCMLDSYRPPAAE